MYFGLNLVSSPYVDTMASNIVSSVVSQRTPVPSSIFSYTPTSTMLGAYNLVMARFASAPKFYNIWSSIGNFASNAGKAIGGAVSSAYHAVTNFASSIVAKAKSYMGYNEANGSYKLFTNGRTEAWCADFVSYCARQCGATNFNFRSVQQIWDWGVQHNRFSKTPKVGDAIIFKGWDAKRHCKASHTGIVTKVENGRVYTVEGNTSDKVAERSYALNDSKITGYVTIA